MSLFNKRMNRPRARSSPALTAPMKPAFFSSRTTVMPSTLGRNSWVLSVEASSTAMTSYWVAELSKASERRQATVSSQLL